MTDPADELREVLARLAEPDESGSALATYLRFRDAVSAVELAVESDIVGVEELRRMLADVGTAALAVFGASGDVTDLDTGERVEDTSAANPLTLLQGLYAALAAGDNATVEALAALPPDRYHTPQAVASDLLSAIAMALQAAARGARADVLRVSDHVITATGGDYSAQLAALTGWARGDAIDMPEGPVLAVLGLRALE